MSREPELAPLGLTVHTLPPTQALVGEGRTRRGRWKMLAVLLVCAAPVIASYFTYYVIRPEGRRNFAELIEPQRSMPGLQAQTPEGRSLPLAALQGQWLLVAVGGGDCDARCERNLYLQRQLREGMGRDKERMDRVWLIPDGVAPPARLQAALQGATVLQLPQAGLRQWLEPAAGQSLDAHLYVVDPQGHWMMRLPADLSTTLAVRAKRDLERLLRASASWDQPGRTPAE